MRLAVTEGIAYWILEAATEDHANLVSVLVDAFLEEYASFLLPEDVDPSIEQNVVSVLLACRAVKALLDLEAMNLRGIQSVLQLSTSTRPGPLTLVKAAVSKSTLLGVVYSKVLEQSDRILDFLPVAGRILEERVR